MSITITKYGMPNQSMHLERDTAEVLLETLALALGMSVTFDANGDIVPCWDGIAKRSVGDGSVTVENSDA